MRHIGDEGRRARLARRHAISPAHRVADPVAATRAMTVLHSTDPATVYLSLQARVDGLEVADVDLALYGDRSLVKQLAMRRTPSRTRTGEVHVELLEDVPEAGRRALDGEAGRLTAWLEGQRAAPSTRRRR